MNTYRLTEVRAYEVKADSREEAEEMFSEYGPEVSTEDPVVDLGVQESGITVGAPLDFGPKNAMEVALSIESVKASSFWRSNEILYGVVYDERVGIEFDVRRETTGLWIVNDDDGRNHGATDLKVALELAIKSNAERQSGGRTA
jgi:hypothetical protein